MCVCVFVCVCVCVFSKRSLAVELAFSFQPMARLGLLVKVFAVCGLAYFFQLVVHSLLAGGCVCRYFADYFCHIFPFKVDTD